MELFDALSPRVDADFWDAFSIRWGPGVRFVLDLHFANGVASFCVTIEAPFGTTRRTARWKDDQDS